MGDLPLRTPTDRRLGGPLPRQLANQTHAHPQASHLTTGRCRPLASSGVNPPFGGLSRSRGKVAYALLTRAPVVSGASSLLPLDLHVLGLSLAFILSQDQTLRCMNCSFLSLSGCPSLCVSTFSVLTVACYAFLSLSFSSIANPSKISLLLCGACPPACAPLPFRKRMQRYCFFLN